MRCTWINKCDRVCKNKNIDGLCKLHIRKTGLLRRELYDIFKLPKDIYANIMLYLDYEYLQIFCNKANNHILHDEYFQKEYLKYNSTCYIRNIGHYLIDKEDKNIKLKTWYNYDNFNYKNEHLIEIVKKFCCHFDSKLLFMDNIIFEKTEIEQHNYCLNNNIPFNWFILAKYKHNIHYISLKFIESIFRGSLRYGFGNFISLSIDQNKHFYVEQLLNFDYNIFDFEKSEDKNDFDSIFTNILLDYHHKINKNTNLDLKHIKNIDTSDSHSLSKKGKIKLIKNILSLDLLNEAPQLYYDHYIRL